MNEIDSLRQELHSHIEKCDQQFNEGNERFDEILKCSKQNNELITTLATDTKDMVELYRDMKGVIRLGVILQRVGIWIIKWPLIGTGIYAIYKWVISLPTTGS